MGKSSIKYPNPWLKKTRTVKKKKYDFSLVGTCSVLLLLSVFIAFIPIFVQVLVESSNNIPENADKTFSDFFRDIICKNDFRYISISVLFILFVERTLLNNEKNTRLIESVDVISFLWLFFVVIMWLLMAANENVIDYINEKSESGVFHLSIGCFAGTIIICFVNIISKCTKIKYVYESVRKQ